MADWGLVAVIIAILAYPLQVLAIPFFIQFFDRAGGWLYRHIWPAAGQCTALEWTDFSSRPWHGTKSLPQAQCCELNSDDLHQASQLLFSGSWEPALSLLFPEPWRKAVVQDKVSKPHQLSATAQYIRTDPAVVLLYVYFSALCCRIIYGDSESKFNHFVQLTEKNGVLVAQMRPNDHLYSNRCQYVCEKLCSTTQTLMLFDIPEDFPESLVLQEASGTALPEVKIKMYSIDSRASWRRGGWVVAVGMSSGESAQSSPLLRPILRNDLVKSSFRYAKDDQYIMLPEHVDDALQRVIYILDDLNEVFHDKHLENALAMTEQFRVNLHQYLTRSSRLGMVLNKSPLFRDNPYQPLREGGWGEMDSQSIDTYEFVIKLFNRYQVLTSNEKEKLRPILEEVSRTALVGMIRVFHFYEYGSADPEERRTIIIEPALLKKYKHVYLEDY